MGKDTITITDANFEEVVLKAKTPVLVDLWAEWCGPCKAIGPAIDELATEFAGKVVVGKLNVDDNGDIATRYGVMSIPTLLIFQDGAEVERLVGARPKNNIKAALEAVLEG